MKKYLLASLMAGLLSFSVAPSYAQSSDPGINRLVQLVSSIVATLTPIRTATENTASAVESNNTLMTSVKKSVDHMLAYVEAVSNYLKDIYEIMSETESASYSAQTRARYIAAPRVAENVRTTADAMIGELSKAFQGSTLQNQKKAFKRVEKYAQYSTTSAASLFSTDMYPSKDSPQAKAAHDFILNITGANLGVPPVDISSDDNENALKYLAYQKTMAAIQSAAASNLVEAYAARLPFNVGTSSDPIQTSGMKVLHDMNLADPANERYWTAGPGSQGVMARLQSFFTSFFTLTYTLNRIADELNKINLQLSLMITQNIMVAHLAYGEALYRQAKMGQRIKF